MLTPALFRQVDAHLDGIKAMHRADLKDMAVEIAESYLPKIVLEKTRTIDDSLAELKQKSKADVKEEVRACVKEFIRRDIRKEPTEVKALEERVAQLEPLAIKLTNENTALMQRNTELESTISELRDKIDVLDSSYLTLTDDICNIRAYSARTTAFVSTHHERLGYPFVPGI
jgi:predicted nuclease with TOPRIM domain